MRSLPHTNDDQLYVRSLLLEMLDNVKTNRPHTEQIINMRVFLESTKAGFSDQEIERIEALLQDFETSTSIAIR